MSVLECSQVVLLDYNCFTKCIKFLLCSSVNQLYLRHPAPSSWASLDPSAHLSGSSQSPELGSMCFRADSHWLSVLHIVVCVRQCFSWLIPPLLPHVSAGFFSTSASPFLPCTQVHLNHLSRFHVYALMYICFSLSDLFTLCDNEDSRFTPVSLQMTQCYSLLHSLLD